MKNKNVNIINITEALVGNEMRQNKRGWLEGQTVFGEDRIGEEVVQYGWTTFERALWWW